MKQPQSLQAVRAWCASIPRFMGAFRPASRAWKTVRTAERAHQLLVWANRLAPAFQETVSPDEVLGAYERVLQVGLEPESARHSVIHFWHQLWFISGRYPSEPLPKACLVEIKAVMLARLYARQGHQEIRLRSGDIVLRYGSQVLYGGHRGGGKSLAIRRAFENAKGGKIECRYDTNRNLERAVRTSDGSSQTFSRED